MNTEVSAALGTEEFDTFDIRVYDSPASSPPNDSMMVAKGNSSEPQLTGLYGWAAIRLGVPPWGQILVFVLFLLSVSVFFWGRDVEKHLSSIDTSLQVLPLQVGRDLLSQANVDITLGKSKTALTATEGATALFAQASIKRIPAKPDFFLNTVASLNILQSHAASPEFSEKIISARLILAGYRSSLEPIPAPHTPEKRVEDSYGITHADTVINPPNVGATTLVFPPGVEAFHNPILRRLSDRNSIEDFIIKGGVATLDGFTWKNVVFVNTLIKYEAGETQLQNVRFVNCTFQMDDSPRATQVADYAALGLTSLRLPPSS